MHDLLIVDSGIESVSGYELCRAIRPVSDLGIILLIPDNDRQTRIDALEAGADDYIVAPFLPEELLARVRALLRRVTPAGSRRPKLILSECVVDLQTREVTGPGRCLSWRISLPKGVRRPADFAVAQRGTNQ